MNHPKIKICGLTLKEQAIAIAEAGVDAIGFIFYRPSPRYIRPEVAANIIKDLPPFTKTVGVFVNEEPSHITDIVRRCCLDLVQLSGEESPEYCHQLETNHVSWLKGVRVKNEQDLNTLNQYDSHYFLLDAWSAKEYGGTGHSFDWNSLSGLESSIKIILAGGITVNNVAEAITLAAPYGIDLSSGVEISPGVKSLEQVRQLLRVIEEMNLTC